MDQPHDRESVLGLFVLQSVAASKDAARFRDLLGPTSQDLGDDLRLQIRRKATNIERQDHLTTHGVDIAHGVGRSDSSVVVGIVHHRREEIERLDDGHVTVNPVNSSVIADLQPHQQVGVLMSLEQVLQRAQDLRQGLRPHLRRSTGRRGHRREPNLLASHVSHSPPVLNKPPGHISHSSPIGSKAHMGTASQIDHFPRPQYRLGDSVHIGHFTHSHPLPQLVVLQAGATGQDLRAPSAQFLEILQHG